MIRIVLNSIVGASPTAPGTELYHGDKGWQNMHADLGEDSYRVYLMDPLRWKPDAMMNEVYDVIIWFLKKSELDMTPDEHEVITDFLRLKVREFIIICRDGIEGSDSKLIDSITEINCEEVWNVFDANFDAIILTAKIKPFRTEPTC